MRVWGVAEVWSRYRLAVSQPLDPDELRDELTSLVLRDGATVAKLVHADELARAFGVSEPEDLRTELERFFEGKSGHLKNLASSLNLDNQPLSLNRRREKFGDGRESTGKASERKGIEEFIELLLADKHRSSAGHKPLLGSGEPVFWSQKNAVVLNPLKGMLLGRLELTLQVDEDMRCRTVRGQITEYPDDMADLRDEERQFELRLDSAASGHLRISHHLLKPEVDDVHLRLIFTREPRVSFLRLYDDATFSFRHDSRSGDLIHTYRIMDRQRYVEWYPEEHNEPIEAGADPFRVALMTDDVLLTTKLEMGFDIYWV